MSSPPVIAIDGPSGSGKGTVCRRVAAELGFHLLDSGALYRLTGLAGRHAGLAPGDEAGHARLARGMQVEFGADERGEAAVQLAHGAARRIVLGAWYEQGSLLRHDAHGYALLALPRNGPE